MPPRFTYWTIILDGQPTAFRAAERDQLLPTLKQLQSRNPAAVLKWFAHGRLWESPEEVWRVRLKAREAAREAAQRDRRGRDWRPGGEHKDPRERFKKETFQARKRRDKKAANLAGVGRGFSPAKDEAPRPAAVARGLPPGRRSPEGDGGSPAKDAAPGRPAPSHKSRMPRLRKPR
jgi:hypothetical protein